LGIGNIQNDISGTNDEVSLSLSGIENDNLYNIFDDNNYRIKGSRIKIYRAFFDPTTNALNNVILRYYGYVVNFNFSEDLDPVAGIGSNVITIQCASIHNLLENLVAGRRTNKKDYQIYFDEPSITEAITSDPSMDYVPGLHNANFDFGKPYTAVRTPIRNGGGGGGGGGTDCDFDFQVP
jgi:hypothetical protein